jgi:cytochrome oxidase Cu insertion factor (SCO1/SenC/PrrC family)
LRVKPKCLLGLALALLCACASGRNACAASSGARTADPRELRLVDQRGAVFSLAGLRGEPVFVTFVATRCTDACPIAEALFARLARRIREEHVRARLVTITLDPAYDTPFVMARLGHELDADPRVWQLASGEPAAIHALMRAFGVVARADAAGIPDVHSTFVYALDARVRLAKTFLLSSNIVSEALRAVPTLASTHSGPA